MKMFQITLSCAVLALLACLSAPPAKADPLWFSNVTALQDDGNTRIDLFSNPGATILATPRMNFLVDITGLLGEHRTDTLTLTYTEAGSGPIVKTYVIPLFGNVNPPFTLLFDFMASGTSGGRTPATLRVDLGGSAPDFIIPSGPNAGQTVDSYTYSFTVAPVPEPATLLLFGTGLVPLASRVVHRRLKKA